MPSPGQPRGSPEPSGMKSFGPARRSDIKQRSTAVCRGARARRPPLFEGSFGEAGAQSPMNPSQTVSQSRFGARTVSSMIVMATDISSISPFQIPPYISMAAIFREALPVLSRKRARLAPPSAVRSILDRPERSQILQPDERLDAIG